MTDDATADQLRQQLRELDTQIARLRQGGQPDAAEGEVRDSEEIAADLTSVEEQQAIAGILEQRRDALREQLRQLGAL